MAAGSAKILIDRSGEFFAALSLAAAASTLPSAEIDKALLRNAIVPSNVRAETS